MQTIIENLQKHFQVVSYHQQRENLGFLIASKEVAVGLITHLRDYEGFAHLVLLTAVDWIEDEHFQLTYLLHHPEKKVDLGVRVMISRQNAEMYSIHHLWEQARTYQRELHEMFGINFPGSPDVDKPFILEGWEDIPPYRRDFDTKEYSEKTYFPRPGRETHDPAEYMKKKLYPNE